MAMVVFSALGQSLVQIEDFLYRRNLAIAEGLVVCRHGFTRLGSCQRLRPHELFEAYPTYHSSA
jgi:hypothetical protein